MVTTSHPTQLPSAPITLARLLGGCAASHASILNRARRSREAEPGVAVQTMICIPGSAFQVSADHSNSSSPTSGCRNSLAPTIRENIIPGGQFCDETTQLRIVRGGGVEPAQLLHRHPGHVLPVRVEPPHPGKNTATNVNQKAPTIA